MLLSPTGVVLSIIFHYCSRKSATRAGHFLAFCAKSRYTDFAFVAAPIPFRFRHFHCTRGYTAVGFTAVPLALATEEFGLRKFGGRRTVLICPGNHGLKAVGSALEAQKCLGWQSLGEEICLGQSHFVLCLV